MGGSVCESAGIAHSNGMSDTPNLVARVEALEKAVQSLLGAVNLLEKLFEKSGVVAGDGNGRGGSTGAKKASGAAKKKRAPVKKRARKN